MPASDASVEDWRVATVGDWDALRSLGDRVERSLPIRHVNHELVHLAALQGWPQHEIVVLVRGADEAPSGIGIFRADRVPLVFSIGPRVIARPRIQRYYLFEGPVLRADAAPGAAAGCLVRLAEEMPSRSAVFAFSVPTESNLGRQVADRRSVLHRTFHVLPWGAENPSCSIDWRGSVDDYLAALGKSRRQDLRRRRNKLRSDATVTTELRCFRSPDEVDDFLRDGAYVSERTWQKARYGTGISTGGSVERTIRHAAGRGEFLGFILYLDGRPAAFKSCFLHGTTCTVDQIGYDPAWTERHHVGSVLFLEMLHYMERERLPLRSIDFMATANLFKLQTTNVHVPVRNYYLFPRTPQGTLLYVCLKATAAITEAAKRLLRRQEPSP